MEIIWAKTTGEKETKVSLIVWFSLEYRDLVQNFSNIKEHISV